MRQGTVVGKEGIERAYDRYLRGVDGVQRITVDALGPAEGHAAGARPGPGPRAAHVARPRPPADRRGALARTIAAGPGTAGAFVAIDPRNGEVLAMGSYPTFDPTVLSRPITQKRFEQLFGPQAGSPLFNRAIGGLLSDGLDVQADHRARRARARA